MIVNVQFRRHIREHSFQRDTAPIYASQLGGSVPPEPPHSLCLSSRRWISFKGQQTRFAFSGNRYHQHRHSDRLRLITRPAFMLSGFMLPLAAISTHGLSAQSSEHEGEVL
jgi:hypothetical protein